MSSIQTLSPWNQFREKIYNLIDNNEEDKRTFWSQTIDFIIAVLIILSLVAIILESFKDVKLEYEKQFRIFELITMVIFITEFTLRVATADFKYKESKSWFSAAVRFMRSGEGIIDLLAIVPFVFELTKIDCRFIRVLRISRLFRVFKLSSLTKSIVIVGDVFYEKRSELGITMFVTFILLLVSATVMWYMESETQPEQFPNIVATFWWAIATLTTVGYGDVYPITPMGKFLSGLIATLGIGIVALPAGILSSAFIEKLELDNEEKEADDSKQLKADLPHAKYQSIKEKEQHKKVSSTPSTESQHHSDCSKEFGKAFRYCPYCGESLENGEHKAH